MRVGRLGRSCSPGGSVRLGRADRVGEAGRAGGAAGWLGRSGRRCGIGGRVRRAGCLVGEANRVGEAWPGGSGGRARREGRAAGRARRPGQACLEEGSVRRGGRAGGSERPDPFFFRNHDTGSVGSFGTMTPGGVPNYPGTMGGMPNHAASCSISHATYGTAGTSAQDRIPPNGSGTAA